MRTQAGSIRMRTLSSSNPSSSSPHLFMSSRMNPWKDHCLRIYNRVRIFLRRHSGRYVKSVMSVDPDSLECSTGSCVCSSVNRSSTLWYVQRLKRISFLILIVSSSHSTGRIDRRNHSSRPTAETVRAFGCSHRCTHKANANRDSKTQRSGLIAATHAFY